MTRPARLAVRLVVAAAALAAAFFAGAAYGPTPGTAAAADAPAIAAGIDDAASDSAEDPAASAVITRASAAAEVSDWGTFYTYLAGETYSTVDGLAGVAVIDAGREIHPPHEHPEEELLMVVEGRGTWHLNGVEQPAASGDLLYARPWDVHGITNTGDAPLTFVVWKWNGRGVPLAEPAE